VLENGIKVVPAFVTPEEKEAAEESFQAVVREKETLASEKATLETQVADLTAQVEALKAAPQGQPAHEEFQAGAIPTTGNKRMDRLSRIMGAK
jgi:phage shock protein A